MVPSFHSCGPAAQSRRQGSLGFTLIEIMLVVGIMAIILAMGIPPMARVMRREPLRQAENDVLEALAQARAQAILQGETSALRIGVDEAETAIVLSVLRPAVSAEPAKTEPGDLRLAAGGSAAPASQAPAFSKRLPPGVTFGALEVNFVGQLESTSDVLVRFFPNGTSDDFVVVLQDPQGQWKVILDPVTGLADSEELR